MAKALEAEIDKLFQLPPDQFTVARNTLAKGAGSAAATIKALTKPPIAAWAVNQLYWQDRERYDALIDAANEMRRTHRAVIEGRKGDLRSAGREHEVALEAALKSAVALMKNAGQPVTDTTRHAILNTLRALPAQEAPGRLTQTLAPGGFEMLAGVTPAAPRRGRTPAAAVTPETTTGGKTKSSGRGSSRAAEAKVEREAARQAAREREQRAAAERAVRDAEQRARQAEFEAARATREATKAERLLEEARRDLEAAQRALESAEQEAEQTVRARDAADRKLRDAQSVLEAARTRA